MTGSRFWAVGASRGHRLVPPPGSAGARSPGRSRGAARRRAPRVDERRRPAQASGCVAVGEEQAVAPLTVGRIASLYYLKHQTMAGFTRGLQPDMAVPDVRMLPRKLLGPGDFLT